MRRTAGPLSIAEVAVAHEERYWYPDDGAIIWIAGYTPVGADGRYLARDAPELTARGLIVSGIAGAARFHDDVLQSADVAPGAALKLVRRPDNEHDPNAIALLTAAGAQAGWVPREIASQIAPALDGGRPWAAVVLRERRSSPLAPRDGLTVLLAPDGAIELHEVPGGRRLYRSAT